MISEAVAIRDFPRQRPFIRNQTAFFKELRPGVAVLPRVRRRCWPMPSRRAPTVLPKTIQTNEDLADVFEALADFSDDPLVRQGIDQPRGCRDRSADAQVPHADPDRLQLRDAVPPQRREPALRGRLERQLAALHGHLGADQQTNKAWPNNEGGPSSAPANGPTRINHLHNNPYPNSAAPGQTRECEAGNERYLQTIGQTILTNQPGNQGTKTSGQK